jgi:hypothetical protein
LLFSSYTNNQAANAYDAIEVLLLGAASRSAGYGWGNPVSLAFAVFFLVGKERKIWNKMEQSWDKWISNVLH